MSAWRYKKVMVYMMTKNNKETTKWDFQQVHVQNL